MKHGNKVALGIYDSRAQVERAIETFRAEGFRNADISVLMPHEDPTFGVEKSTKAPEGTAVGTGAGAILGGTLGWLVGLGAIATIPLLGPLVAAGPIMAALSGVAVGGMIGGLTGALVGLGIPEYEAVRYETFVKEGGILLSAHADNEEWNRKARDVLERTGARDISSTIEERADEHRRFIPPTPSTYAP